MKKVRFIFSAVLLVTLIFSGINALAADSPVKLGFVYIMSGPFATYGQFAKQGAELAIDEINKAGGINGHKIEAFFEDSAGKPDVGIRVIRKLVYDNGVDAAIGLDSRTFPKTFLRTLSLEVILRA